MTKKAGASQLGRIINMLKYKINVMDSLKKAGYSSYFMEKNKVFGSNTLQKMRSGIVVGATALDRLCELLQCQPGDLIAWVPDEDSTSDDSMNQAGMQ